MGKRSLLVLVWCITLFKTQAGNGYDLWLRYEKINDLTLSAQYRALLAQLVAGQNSPTIAGLSLAKDWQHMG